MQTEGVRIKVNVGGEYKLVGEWFGPQGQMSPPEKKARYAYMMSHTRYDNPPLFERSFQSPSVRPDKSFYLYFEADEPLELKDETFEEY